MSLHLFSTARQAPRTAPAATPHCYTCISSKRVSTPVSCLGKTSESAGGVYNSNRQDTGVAGCRLPKLASTFPSRAHRRPRRLLRYEQRNHRKLPMLSRRARRRSWRRFGRCETPRSPTRYRTSERRLAISARSAKSFTATVGSRSAPPSSARLSKDRDSDCGDAPVEFSVKFAEGDDGFPLPTMQNFSQGDVWFERRAKRRARAPWLRHVDIIRLKWAAAASSFSFSPPFALALNSARERDISRALGRVDVSACGCRSPKFRGRGRRANAVPKHLDSRFRGNDGVNQE